MSELADHTGYEPSSGHNRSLVAIIAEKKQRRRHVLCSTSKRQILEYMQCVDRLVAFGYVVGDGPALAKSLPMSKNI